MSDDSIWDLNAVLKEFEGEEEILIDSCEMFIELYPEHLTKLKDYFSEANFKAFGEEAHSVKGMVGYFNKTTVYESAKKIEVTAREGGYSSPEQAQVDYEDLENNLTKLAEHIKGYLSSKQAA